jgi:hypothetical protein
MFRCKSLDEVREVLTYWYQTFSSREIDAAERLAFLFLNSDLQSVKNALKEWTLEEIVVLRQALPDGLAIAPERREFLRQMFELLENLPSQFPWESK